MLGAAHLEGSTALAGQGLPSAGTRGKPGALPEPEARGIHGIIAGFELVGDPKGSSQPDPPEAEGGMIPCLGAEHWRCCPGWPGCPIPGDIPETAGHTPE